MAKLSVNAMIGLWARSTEVIYSVRSSSSELDGAGADLSQAFAYEGGMVWDFVYATSSSVILAAMSGECWSTTVLRPQLAATGRRGAVVGQQQVHAVRGALGGHHALQHVEGRLVCLVGETRGQQALQRGDAA